MIRKNRKEKSMREFIYPKIYTESCPKGPLQEIVSHKLSALLFEV